MVVVYELLHLFVICAETMRIVLIKIKIKIKHIIEEGRDFLPKYRQPEPGG